MMKKKRYMIYAERLKLEALREAKIPVQEIARQLGFSRQTIYNELKRGAYVHDCGWYDAVRYSADKAQQIHDQRQTAKRRPLKIGNDHAYANFLERKILHERFHQRRPWPRPGRKALRPGSAWERSTATSPQGYSSP